MKKMLASSSQQLPILKHLRHFISCPNSQMEAAAPFHPLLLLLSSLELKVLLLINFFNILLIYPQALIEQSTRLVSLRILEYI